MILNEPSINGWLRRHPTINLGHVQHSAPRRSPRNVILAVLFAVVLLELLYILGALR